MNALTVGAPIPESIGRTADEYAEVRELRLEMQKQVDEVKARESELRESIINRLSKSEDTGAAGLRYRAQVVSKRTFKVSDWGVLYSWIKKNDRFDMLQKRLADAAAKEFAEVENRNVPGTEVVNVPDVSITKI